MNEFVEYQFRILEVRPESIPMARLATYMLEFARFLGSIEDVHFEEVRAESVGLVALAEQEAMPVISPRIRAAGRGVEGADAASHFTKLNEYLHEDGFTAEVSLPNSAEIIQFPGKAKPAKAIRSVNQPTTVQGRLIRIEGAGDPVKIGLAIDGDLTAKISLPASQIPELGQHWGRSVRLSGDGRWSRSSEGRWTLDNLAAQSFEVLDDATLIEALDRMRKIMPEGSGRAVVDAVEELRRA